MYIFGREVELETDHKPLECIYSKKSKPPARIERWVLRLQAYDFKVVYRPGRTNIADALSRLNSEPQRDKGDTYDFVRAVAENSVPVALTPAEIEQASAKDPELKHIKQCVRTGDWNTADAKGYIHVRQELSVYGELLLRGTRLVIPQALRAQVLHLAHEGHQGIAKTKHRLRSKVWWPKMDAEAEKVCKTCHGCQVVGGYPAPEPMARHALPSGPWQDCSADLLGPLPSGEHLLVVVDYYSRYFEVTIMKTTTSAKLIEVMTPIFARFGTPYSLRTDNGPQFVSDEFESFLREHGIEHRRTPPLWPQANGEVERQNSTLLKALRVAQVERKNWREELHRLLTAYRSTPQTTTGASPFYMMFGREMKTKLPEVPRQEPIMDEEIRDRDWSRKLTGKEYSDSRRHAVKSQVKVGDRVLVKNAKTGKLSPNFDPNPYEVLKKERGELTMLSKDGVLMKRSAAFVKKYHSNGATQQVAEPEVETVQTECPAEQPEVPEGTRAEAHGDKPDSGSLKGTEDHPNQPQVEPRPQRARRMPARFKDFVCS